MTRIRSLLLTVVMVLSALGVVQISQAPKASAQDAVWAAVQDGVNNAAAKGITQYVYVMDRRTGQSLAWTSNAWTQVASESLVKLHIAAYQLHSHGGNASAAGCDMWSMVTASADAPASTCWRNDIVGWASGHYDLRGSHNNPPRPGWWGATRVNASDMAWLVWRLLAQDQVAGPWISHAMSNATDVAADGMHHNWGFNAIPAAGSKQGWGNDSYWNGPMAVHTVGFTDDVVAAVLQTAPSWMSWNTMFDTATYTARLIDEASQYAPGTPMDPGWHAYGGPMGPGRATAGYTCGLKDGWCYQRFTNGFMYRAPDGYISWTRDPVYSEWAVRGHENGWLGYPLGSFNLQDRGWQYQDFQGGELLRRPDGFWVESRGAIRGAWANQGYQTGAVGYPVTNEIPLSDGGVYQIYETGRIMWNPATNAHAMYGPILDSWSERGYEHGWLGYPRSAVTNQIRGWSFQDFQGGSLLKSPWGAVYESRGPIRDAWAASGWANGPLGYPISDIITLADGGQFQAYEGGRIMWTQETGAHVMTGPVLSAWVAQGFEHSLLGYPTSELTNQIRGWKYQDFEGGSLLLAPWGEAFESTGTTRQVWANNGWANGPLGYPITNVLTLSDGGQFQLYEYGRIMVSPSGITAAMYGPLLSAWAEQDYERGSLGYPVSDPVCTQTSCTQQFEHRTLHSDPNGVVTPR